MASYRVYRACFPFEAREESELTIHEEDTVFVYEKPSGGWPDPEKWMHGVNKSSGKAGDFPGTYCEFVEEVSAPPPVVQRSPVHLPTPPPPSEDSAPPVPPRRSPGESGREKRVMLCVSLSGWVLY